MSEPPVVLGVELVLDGRSVRIAFSPERFDEPRARLQRLDAEKRFPFGIGDDVDDFFFEPLAVLGREAIEPLVSRQRREHEAAERRDRDG